ncbi:MAG: CPBP family intramembrane metalloprotease [Flavobacteriia bacterium]|nr:CPBP family intramembrane metalloprotease [Flavobacteriia bacterium]
MNFIDLGSKGDNKITSYIFTILLIVLGFLTLGQLPLFVLYLIKQEASSTLLHTQHDVMKSIGLNSFFATVMFPFLISLLALFIGLKFLHKRKLRTAFTSRDRFDFKRFFLSFFIWIFVSFGFLAFTFFKEDTIHFNFDSSKFFILLLLSLIFVPIQTCFEEIFFRGYLIQGLKSAYKKAWLAVLLSSILFGLLHFSNPEVDKLGKILLIYYILSGLFLGLLTLMDDGIELSFGYHLANNIFAAVILTNEWQAFRTDALFLDNSKPEFSVENLLTIFLLQPLLLILFSKIYKWKNWKEKLFN